MSDKEAVSRNVDIPAEPFKNPQGRHISSRELYLQLTHDNSKSASIKLTTKQLGKELSGILLKGIDTTGIMISPPKNRYRESTYDHLDEAQKSAVQRHVHSFILNNELPTCTKILSVCNADDSLSELKQTTKVSKKLGFKWKKQGRNNILIERQDIILWRRRKSADIIKLLEVGLRQRNCKVSRMRDTNR